MQDLFKLLPKLIDQFEDSGEVREAVVIAAWKRAAGDSLSSQTAAVELRNKQLFVAVKDETWKHHLESLSGQMIFKLNLILGQTAVTFINFRIDEDLVFEHSKSLVDKSVSEEERRELALREVSSNLRISANNIADEKLRNQFLLAAGSCLARKRRLAGAD